MRAQMAQGVGVMGSSGRAESSETTQGMPAAVPGDGKAARPLVPVSDVLTASSATVATMRAGVTLHMECRCAECRLLEIVADVYDRLPLWKRVWLLIRGRAYGLRVAPE